jgi:hypothetical protein
LIIGGLFGSRFCFALGQSEQNKSGIYFIDVGLLLCLSIAYCCIKQLKNFHSYWYSHGFGLVLSCGGTVSIVVFKEPAAFGEAFKTLITYC